MDSVLVEAPDIIQVYGLGARIIRVQWRPIQSDVSNPVSGYRVRADTDVRTEPFVQDLSANTTICIIHGLSPYRYTGRPGVMYNVSVAAFNSDGEGPSSRTVSVILPREWACLMSIVYYDHCTCTCSIKL